jgi:hypothetical protein
MPMLNSPLYFSLSLLAVMALSAWIGNALRGQRAMKQDERSDFDVIQAATLTLLGLIIGFSFSMATSRYDLRKNYEEEEANAIGTEYVRAELLPALDAATIRSELQKYLTLRIDFYEACISSAGRFPSCDTSELERINAETATLQTQLWNAVKTPAMAQPDAVRALVVEGMNDVLNRQGYTQAAWWNRIPASAWALMVGLAVCANVLVGYGIRSERVRHSLLFVMPLVIAISFLLIADIDSPRGGLIHVAPQNLVSLAESIGK